MNYKEEKDQKYGEAIKSLAEKNDGFLFNTSDDQHTLIVINNILKKAKNINMIIKDISANISEDEEFNDLLKDFILNKGNLNIIIDGEINPDMKIFKTLNYIQRLWPKKILIKKNTKYGITQSFIIGDDKMFIVNSKSDNGEDYYFCSFNKPDQCLTLNNKFNEIFGTISTIFDLNEELKLKNNKTKASNESGLFELMKNINEEIFKPIPNIDSIKKIMSEINKIL